MRLGWYLQHERDGSALVRASALFGVHVVSSSFAALCSRPPALEDCALLASVLMEVLHFVPRVPLGFLYTRLENEHFFLLRGVFLLLLPESSLYPLENFHVVLKAVGVSRNWVLGEKKILCTRAQTHLCDDADRAAALTRTCCSSDSVDIRLTVAWQIVVDDKLSCVNMHARGSVVARSQGQGGRALTSTFGMSRPRAATSVATRISRLPALNLFSAPRRLDWLSWPCSGMAPRPRVRRRIARRCVSLTVLVKTTVDWPGNSFANR